MKQTIRENILWNALGNKKYNLITHSQNKNVTAYSVKEGETKHCCQKYKLHFNIAVWEATLKL